MTTDDTKKQIVELAKKYNDLGNRLFNLNKPTPNVVFKMKGTTGGTANPSKWTITCQVSMHARNPDQLEPTIGHEVAHLFAEELNPDKGKTYFARKRLRYVTVGHGPLWKQIMRKFGLPPERCHTMDPGFDRKNTTKYIYKCACSRPLPIGPKRHKKAQTRVRAGGTSGYTCRKCKQKIEFTGKVTTAHALYAQQNNIALPVEKPMTPAPRVPAPVKRVRTPVSGGSKKDLAKRIFNDGSSRSEIIGRFISELSMTKAGASTYYYNFNKGGW